MYRAAFKYLTCLMAMLMAGLASSCFACPIESLQKSKGPYWWYERELDSLTRFDKCVEGFDRMSAVKSTDLAIHFEPYCFVERLSFKPFPVFHCLPLPGDSSEPAPESEVASRSESGSLDVPGLEYIKLKPHSFVEYLKKRPFFLNPQRCVVNLCCVPLVPVQYSYPSRTIWNPDPRAYRYCDFGTTNIPQDPKSQINSYRPLRNPEQL
jgi:hypothetical protein